MSAMGHVLRTGTPPVEITNHTSVWATFGPSLLAALLAAGAVLGGAALNQWAQRRNDRYAAIRKDRIEKVINFLDAASAVQEVTQATFPTRAPTPGRWRDTPATPRQR